MGWIQRLYETYENCRGAVGNETDESKVPLLPICHTTQKAHVEITIDGEGNFKKARVVPKDESRTIIPCTERSGGRTSGPAAHPLCDKLQYIAKGYKKYGGGKKTCFHLYEKELGEWCKSEYSHLKAQAVLKYVKKGNVIRDLIKYKTLLVDKNSKFIKKGGYKSEKNIFSIFDVVKPQEEAFVRWVVEIPDELESRVWKDKSLWEMWIKYYINTKDGKTLCYVLGKTGLAADQHPAKLRNDGDKAKIISSGKTQGQDGKVRVDDGCGFTFLGRFTNADQANGVSFEVTQKAHNALRWLISRQGYRKNEQAIVAWATSGKDIPQPLYDPLEILGLTQLPNDEAETAYTAQNIGLKFKNRIKGYGSEIGSKDEVAVIGLDSATPGRTAITYYRKLAGSEYLERIDKWHATCVWLHRYRFVQIQESGKNKRIPLPFIGAPAPRDIATAAYGERVDDKLIKTTVERLLPCIIDGLPIQRDIVESAIRRASNRVAFTKEENFNWEKTLSIACALFRKFKEKEEYSMALDLERKTRDYLYGRLLALAESLEQWALNITNENRQTNAARLMNRFAERPYSTWRTIELALQPYKARLGGVSKKRQDMIDDVVSSFKTDDFLNDKRLSGEFLLGYHSQREFLRSMVKSEEKENEN
jgi:CRISPR-associated protein Csd1